MGIEWLAEQLDIPENDIERFITEAPTPLHDAIGTLGAHAAEYVMRSEFPEYYWMFKLCTRSLPTHIRLRGHEKELRHDFDELLRQGELFLASDADSVLKTVYSRALERMPSILSCKCGRKLTLPYNLTM